MLVALKRKSGRSPALQPLENYLERQKIFWLSVCPTGGLSRGPRHLDSRSANQAGNYPRFPDCLLRASLFQGGRLNREEARKTRWIETIPRRGYRFKGVVSEPQDQPPTDTPFSIAVLPFRALTSQAELQELGIGIADAVILSLCTTGQIVVRPLSAVLPFAYSEQDSLTIGKDLDVDTVLEGTLQQFGERVRVSARLLTCPAGEDIWASTQESKTGDLFAIQDQMARQAADGVAMHLSHGERAPIYNPHGSNAEVHSLYLKARYCWQRWVPESSRRALEYLDAAITLDPGHAPSHAWRAAAWSTLGILGAVSPREVASNARQAARRAIEIDDGFSDGHEMLGAVHLFSTLR